MKEDIIEILFQYREALSSDNESLGAIKGHEVDIMLNVERPYPPLLRRTAYPASPRAKEKFETHINELMKLGVFRNVGHNEEVEVTTPLVITWNNDKSKMVGYFRELNTYTITDRYPIPRINETLNQLSKAKFITSMDSLEGFHQNVWKPYSRKSLRIISHCGIYGYFRIPFDIKNEPSHYQRMITTIFPHENSYCLSEWESPNKPYNPAYVPENAETETPIEGINIKDVGTEFFEEVRESYKKYKNSHILTCILDKDCKDAALDNPLNDIWKESYDNERFHLFNGILYHRSKHTCSCAWWTSWRKDVIEYFHSCDRCQNSNKANGKRFGLIIHIQEPRTPLEVAHMDWVTVLPPGGEKATMHVFDRDSKFTSALWKNLHKILGKKLSFSTAYHPQTDGLSEKVIQTLEDIIRGVLAYDLELKDSNGFTHDWCTLISALESAYKTSIHVSTGKAPAMLEKRWNPKLPVDTLKKDLVDIHPTASRFKILHDKVKHHANKSMTDAFEYSKKKWDKSHKTPEFEVSDLILVSTLNFNNIEGPKKIKRFLCRTIDY
ncbi:hypothetical protein O181_075520 [Austropuccinia psidii MF-1]|uniref:Integrase catalytic domain-containing protein n=1 Tax=Austropuccinia psidii MF-1 TaxID=1389203 RepID=A0A9Q3FEJ1_9BASI|nr:hypothetical protein [Austropuccinia psidii MF-1]